MSIDANPAEEDPSGERAAENIWARLRSLLEEEHQMWTSSETTELFEKIANSENKDEADERLIAAFHAGKNQIEKELEAFPLLRNFTQKILLSAKQIAASKKNDLADKIFSDYRRAEARIKIFRLWININEIGAHPDSPRREEKAFAKQQLVASIDRAEQQLNSAVKAFSERFKRHLHKDHDDIISDVTKYFLETTKEIVIDLDRALDEFYKQGRSIQPLVERAMRSNVNSQSEDLRQQTEKNAAQDAEKLAQEAVKVAQNKEMVARIKQKEGAVADQRKIEVAENELMQANRNLKEAQDRLRNSQANEDGVQKRLASTKRGIGDDEEYRNVARFANDHELSPEWTRKLLHRFKKEQEGTECCSKIVHNKSKKKNAKSGLGIKGNECIRKFEDFLKKFAEEKGRPKRRTSRKKDN